MSNITREDLVPVETAKTLEEAQAAGLAILDKMGPGCEHGMKANKYAFMQQRIKESRRKDNVISIMYNMFLSGEGLSVVGSNYQRNMA